MRIKLYLLASLTLILSALTIDARDMPAKAAWFAGTAPFQGVTHFDNLFSATGSLLANNPSPQTVSNVGDPSLYPAFGVSASGWNFTVTASTGNVSAAVAGSGALAAPSDWCIRLNRQLSPNTVQTVGVKANNAEHFQLLSVYFKANLIPNNPSTLADITLTGYKSGVPVAGAALTIASIQTNVWTKFDVSADADFIGVDEFRFSQAASTSVQISSMFIDEIALPTTPLPLTLGSFSGQRDNSTVTLDWTTLMEQNTDHFEIQRTTTAADFRSIGQVKAAGNSALPLNYEFKDDLPTPASPQYYYRLKMADLDGRYTYSPIVIINASGSPFGLSAYPNPVQSTTTLTAIAPAAGHAQLTVTDLAGRQLLIRAVSLQKGTNTLPLPFFGGLQKGIYVVRLVSQDQTETIRLLKTD